MNVRFEYLYRDAGNFKSWGEVVFSNPRNLDAKVIAKMAESLLLDRSYFVATKVRLPDLHFPDFNHELDHDWHEAQSFELTADGPSDEEHRSIEEFVESLRSTSEA
jgi:hypothetical protein